MAADLFGDWALVAGDLATAALVGTAVWAGHKAAGEVRNQLGTQRELHRQQRVFELQSALNSRDFIQLTAKTNDFIDSFPTDEADADKRWTKASNEDRMTVLAVFNFYELIATEYNADVIDRASADLYLSYAAVGYWNYAEPLVAYLRSQDGSYYAEWKHLNNRYGKLIETAAREHLESYEDDGTVVGASSVPAAAEAPPVGEEIHLPGPSILPLLSAVAVMLILIGLTTTLLLSLAGGTLLVWTSARWIKDVRTDMDHLPWDHRPR
jgi:hypothetical protein